MQARFLTKVVDNYQAMKAQSSIHPSRLVKPTQQVPPVSDNTTNSTQHSSNLFQRSPSTKEHVTSATERSAQGEEEQLDTQQSQLMSSNYSFSDNEMWEKMFAEAGFRLNDGVFMPEVMTP